MPTSRWRRSTVLSASLALAVSGCGEQAPLLDRDPRAEEACQELEYADIETLTADQKGAALADAVTAARLATTPGVREAVEGDVDLTSDAQREVLRDACEEAGYAFFLD